MMGCPSGGSSAPLGEYAGLVGDSAGGPVLHHQPFLLVCVADLPGIVGRLCVRVIGLAPAYLVGWACPWLAHCFKWDGDWAISKCLAPSPT